MTKVAFLVVFVVVATFGLQAVWAHLRLATLASLLDATVGRVAELEMASAIRDQLGDECRCQHLAMGPEGLQPCEGTAMVLVEAPTGGLHAYCSLHQPPAEHAQWADASSAA